MLTERQVDILTFEGNHPEASSGVKHGLVREAWGIKMASYYQELFQIIDMPEALADPRFTLIVKRAQRQKVERTERRAARRPA